MKNSSTRALSLPRAALISSSGQSPPLPPPLLASPSSAPTASPSPPLPPPPSPPVHRPRPLPLLLLPRWRRRRPNRLLLHPLLPRYVFSWCERVGWMKNSSTRALSLHRVALISPPPPLPGSLSRAIASPSSSPPRLSLLGANGLPLSTSAFAAIPTGPPSASASPAPAPMAPAPPPATTPCTTLRSATASTPSNLWRNRDLEGSLTRMASRGTFMVSRIPELRSFDEETPDGGGK